MNRIRYVVIVLINLFFLFLLNFPALGKDSSTYINLEDDDLFIRKILLVVSKDNIGGIYSNPLSEHLKNIISGERQWDLVLPSESNQIIYEKQRFSENPSFVAQTLSQEKSNALLNLETTKGPNGISIHLSLYTAREGKVLVRESLNNFDGFELSILKTKVSQLFYQLKNRLPFKGYVLSRNGLNITLNLGEAFKLGPGHKVDLFQILKINRHPKLGFMVSTEKEIVGKAQIYKVDRSISFALITFEKEPGIVSPGTKASPEGFIHYQSPLINPDHGLVSQQTLGNQNDSVFGENPKEWLPMEDPQFGRISFLGGLGQYNQTVDLEGQNSYSVSNKIVPTLKLSAEFWLNSEWHFGFKTRQSVFSVTNSLPDSTPSSLNVSLSQYDLYGLYNFLLHGDFWGPKFQISLGQHLAHFDPNSGTPTALTKMSYGGTYIGLSSSFNGSSESHLQLGAHYKYFITKTLTEDPTSGKTASSNINMFGFFGAIGKNKYFRWIGELDFESYSSDFSGTGTRINPASKISHQNLFALGGFEYLF